MTSILKAVILAGGSGARMSPETKSVPKPMLPVFADGCLKPIIQVNFEMLFKSGIRNFVIVIGKNDIIRKHFAIDKIFQEQVEAKGNKKLSSQLQSFYSMVRASNIRFATQVGRGTGDTLLKIHGLLGDDFVIAASDSLIDGLPKIGSNTVLVIKTNDPSRFSTVKVVEGTIKKIGVGSKKQIGAYGLLPYMRFDRSIIEALHTTKPRSDGLHIHDAISTLIKKKKVHVVEVNEYHNLNDAESYMKYLTRASL